MDGEGLAPALRRGTAVIIGLLVLTALEYGVAVTVEQGAILYLSALAVLKAGLIMNHFMHLPQLWAGEGGER